MTDTVVSDAVKFPHDEGLPGISDGSESWDSAGLLMMLAQAVDSGSYVRSDSELVFTGHDAANDEVDVTGGAAYLSLSGESVEVQSTLGGSVPPAYDTALPTLPAIMVVLPSTVSGLSVQDGVLSSIWLAYATDGAVGGVSVGDVYVRSDDTGGVSAPPHPSVKLGEANPDDASGDVLENRGGVTGVDYVQDSEPDYREGVTWVSPTSGVFSAGYDAGGGGSYHQVGIDNHSELAGVTANQHHTPPAVYGDEGGVIDFGSIGSGDFSEENVTFTESYSSPPMVLSTAGSTSGTANANVTVENITTNDMTLRVTNLAGASIDYDHVTYVVFSEP